MSIARTLAIATMSLAGISVAQESSRYSGTWLAEFETLRGAKTEATLVVSDQGGTWNSLPVARNDPCVGRPFPIAIQRATAEELVFEVPRSKTIAGCKDSVFTLKRSDDTTLQGEFDEGRKVKLVRK
jgi:hypothetical protein